jgi:hypothetical protein
LSLQKKGLKLTISKILSRCNESLGRDIILNILRRVKDLFTPAAVDKSAYWVHVQCDDCGEKLRTRINLFNDLSIRYGDAGEETTYFCRKTLIGSERCFRPIEIELTFDEQRRLIDKKVQGGQFISEEEYLTE